MRTVGLLVFLWGCGGGQTWHDRMIEDMCFNKCPECCANSTAQMDDGEVCIEENQDRITLEGWSADRLKEWCDGGIDANL